MAINPIVYTENVVRSFLRYQLTTYAFADERLNTRMRELLSLDETRETPLLKGPYISLSRAFRSGVSVEQLVSDGVLHEHLRQLIPFPHVYGHQEEAIRAIQQGRSTLISTGTGSGKSECFLYPIISRCLELRDVGAEPGICAVIVYPMNALAEDQLQRLRELLAGSGISFGMYVGKTPEREADVSGVRMYPVDSHAAYMAQLAEVRASKEGKGVSVHPSDEVCSREMMRKAGHQPRILLTNVKQLELLLTRQRDIELFDHARLDYLVFDEAHTFTGAQGAESACLVRRLRSFCGRSPEDTVCVATSATIVDSRNTAASREFAARFFGAPVEDITTVTETYEPQTWASERTVPTAPDDPAAALDAARMAVDAENPGEAVCAFWSRFVGTSSAISPDHWEEDLYVVLSRNELLWQAADLLATPRDLAGLLDDLVERVGRPVSEEELMMWLVLGTAARYENRPLVRPVVHAFVRGVPGAMVSFTEDGTPQLHLSAEEDTDDDADTLKLRVSTCTTCGQHYFEHYLADFEYTGSVPGGGQADGEVTYWETQDVAQGGQRVLLVDRLISSDDNDEEESSRHLSAIHICRRCGAAHSDDQSRCLACGVAGELIPLYVVVQQADHEGALTRCVCCGANGRTLAGRFREPAKPVRATNVADVHVLAQDMVHHAERKRLLVFADNRQDAAFQAGWMRDHSRRFRLRELMAEKLAEGPVSIGDMAYYLDTLMEADDALSRALLPEVWAIHPSKEAAGTAHREDRRHALRIQVLLEITQSANQQIGLEPWGRLKVNYVGLDETTSFIQNWARELRLPADELAGGIAALLDHHRRRKILHYSADDIFSSFQGDGNRDLLSGYIPELKGIPQGVKFSRDANDDQNRVKQWVSQGRRTMLSDLALKWGVPSERTHDFLQELWGFLTDPDRALLVPVTLKGTRGGVLPNTHGSHQVNGDNIVLTLNQTGFFRCKTCRRRMAARRVPLNRCLAWNCNGEMEHCPEDADNYDLSLIDREYTMLRPREHTAMVPNAERENLEQIFKGQSDSINTLVCTQTLELGVDIGALDAVLMRNVPPLPANYWQRVGRAGRRHRMAVDLTYCRQVSHDRAYFADPPKMLDGRVEPPSFNLSNPLMVAKHVHAAVITQLFKLGRDNSPLLEADRMEVREVLRDVLPAMVCSYLFHENGQIRTEPKDITALNTIITKHREHIEYAIVCAFRQGWPEADGDVVSGEALSGHVLGMTEALEAVLKRLFRRLRWAMEQMRQLNVKQENLGSLPEEDQAFHRRCNHLVQRLKGVGRRRRHEAEGYDDSFTYGVLAAEGFLPGYGLETGSVRGMAEVPSFVRGLGDFDLPRPPAIALREYVPGNLIYANGQRFVPRRYAFDAEERSERVVLEVSREREAVRQIQGSATSDPAADILTSIPICDVTLMHQSRISDEEENRFQMGVCIYGRDLGQHHGGQVFTWGDCELQLRKAMHVQLVNVGARLGIARDNHLGYPVCQTCGQSISPFSSQRQQEVFRENHLERCNCRPDGVAFHANLTADALLLPDCSNRIEAYSLFEGLRFGATQVLDMDLEDLQVIVLGRFDSDECDAVLYDPMPGGSGLLEQLLERFSEVVTAMEEIAQACPAQCDTSCIDCFRTYRNAFYHEHLDRNMMIERIHDCGSRLGDPMDIPPRRPVHEPEQNEQPVNVAERRLQAMLERAGFPPGEWQQQIRFNDLPHTMNSTTPDVSFHDPDDPNLLILIYLDGLSAHIHGHAATQQRDRQIRADLRARGHEVIEIAVSDMDDRNVMLRHFRKLARYLLGRDDARRVGEDVDDWFGGNNDDNVETDFEQEREDNNILPFEWVDPDPSEYGITCVPVYSLQAVAGTFGEFQHPEPEGWARFDTSRNFNNKMFIAQVSGHSMEPTIPDGSWCLFTSEVGGPRDNRILILQHRDISDPETGGCYTIKKYKRLPQGDGERGGRITLQPNNPDYEPIIIDSGEALSVIGELLEIL
ncbi:MAG: DEAD/DEAH box helicase [Spartobacteria bacterium]|nr:DEAD/DEAH box helicase [Spartobacteria bacterium]